MPQLMGATDLISRSWENFRRNGSQYAEFVVWIVVLTLVQWTLDVSLKAIIADKYLRLSVYIMASVPAGLGFAGVAAAMIDYTARSVQKRKASVRDSIHAGFHKLLPFVWVSILLSAAVGLGFLLFVIPALIFYVWYKFSTYAMVVEDARGFGALGASKAVVDGRWWAVMWRTVVPVVFFSMAASFVTAIVYLVIGSVLGDPRLFFGSVADYDQLSNAHTLITAVVPQVVDGFALALLLGADITLWLDLKKKA